MSNDKLDRVEELKNKLFNKNYRVRLEDRASFTRQKTKEVPDTWVEEKDKVGLDEKFFLKTSMFKKFFIFSIVFFILAIAFASYTFFIGGNSVSNDNIEISVLGNAFTAGGEELPLQIEIVNKNNAPLDLVDLVVEYSKSSAGDLSADNERLRTSLGTIPAGGIKNENVKITLFGEQGSVRSVKISIEYRVEGSNAIFVKEKLFEVSISSAPINLSVDAPTEISPNQEVVLDVKTTLNATKAASKILLRVDYPVGFEFESATPTPSFGNNVWVLGDLPPGSERDVSIVGKMVDVSDGEEKSFHVFSGSQSDTDKSTIGIIFNSLGHLITIKRPFIEAKLYVNGIYQREYATDSKTAINGEIRWVNNLDTKIDDLAITAKIFGNGFNYRTINASQGFYNSATNTILWDKNTKSDFAEVNPGDAGSVTFTVSPLSLFSASSGMLSEPTIDIDVSIKGNQISEGSTLQDLTNSESKVIKIISDVGLTAKALYYSGPFTNIGPIPPKVGTPTTYTITWALSNTSNNISKAQVRSTLPTWASFVGTISPPAEDLNYNPSTKEIIWNIGGIPTGTGISSTDREVSFQVSISPSFSQLNTTPVIINDAVLTGHDDFANIDVTVNKNSLNTLLSNDPAFPVTGSRVTE